METVTLKMESQLLKEIDRNLSANLYSTRTEFIRDSIRAKLTEIEKQKAIKKLAEMRGCMKGKAKLSDEEAKEQVFADIVRERGLKL